MDERPDLEGGLRGAGPQEGLLGCSDGPQVSCPGEAIGGAVHQSFVTVTFLVLGDPKPPWNILAQVPQGWPLRVPLEQDQPCQPREGLLTK